MKSREVLKKEGERIARQIARTWPRDPKKLADLKRITDELDELTAWTEQLKKEVARFKQQFWKLSAKVKQARFLDEENLLEQPGDTEEYAGEAQEQKQRRQTEKLLDELLVGKGLSFDLETFVDWFQVMWEETRPEWEEDLAAPQTIVRETLLQLIKRLREDLEETEIGNDEDTELDYEDTEA